MKCPRRDESFARVSNYPQEDEWGSDRTCSYCGSLDPEIALKLIEEGNEVEPTDKNYKIYIRGANTPSGKCYLPHFSPDQGQKFTELYNEKRMKLAYPGRFYVRPYFWIKELDA